MPEDHIEDNEVLYRRVPNTPELVSIVEGALRCSSAAFNDRTQKPSVDRARLRHSPSETQLDTTDGVASLITTEVRAISIENTGAGEDDPKQYSVDVVARPIDADNPEGLPENRAHAQVESDPAFASPSRFKKLKEALAYLANKREWAVELH